MATYAHTRREQYTADVDAANAHFRETGDLKAYQALNKAARESWHADIRAHYNDDNTNDALRRALAEGGRVYADTVDGQIVSLHNVGNLYDVSDVTGSPAEPLIARLASNFRVTYTTVADLISRA